MTKSEKKKQAQIKMNKACIRLTKARKCGDIFAVYRKSEDVTVGHAWYLYMKDLELVAYANAPSLNMES